MKHFILTIPFFLLFEWGAAFPADPDSLFMKYVDQAVDFAKNNQPDSVEYYQNLAGAHFKVTDDLSHWIKLYEKICAAHWKAGRYEEALEVFYQGFEKKWRKPKTEQEHEKLAWFCSHAGYCYRRLDDKPAAIEWYGLAASILRDTLNIEDVTVARSIYGQLGNAHTRLRDYEKAKYYHQRRLNIGMREKDWDLAAGASNDLGMVFLYQEDFKQAVETFQDGLDLESEDVEMTIKLLENLALAHFKNGALKRMWQVNRQCEKLIRTSDLPDDKKKASLVAVAENDAYYFEALHDFPAAVRQTDQALKIVHALDPEDLRSLALLQIQRAAIFQNWQKWDEAIAGYQAALHNFVPAFKHKNPDWQPDAGQLPAEPNLIETLAGKGASFMGRHQTSGDWEDVRRAMECYELAMAVENRLLQDYVLEGSRLTAQREHRWYREAALGTAFEIWQKEKTAAAAARLFAISEQSRAFMLLESVQVNDAMKADKAGDSLRPVYYRLNDQIAKIETALSEDRNSPSTLDSLKKALIRVKEERAAVIEKILAANPALDVLKKDPLAALRAVQAELGPDRMLVEYFAGQHRLFIFAVTQSGFQAWQPPLPAELDDTIKDFKTALTDQPVTRLNENKPVFARCAYRLYHWLLADVLAGSASGVNRLTIVPDGMLGYLPFELLVKEEARGDFFYGKLHYLLRDFSVSYAPSAELFVRQSHKERGRAPENMAGFAPSYDKMPVAVNDAVDQALLAALTRDGEFDLQGTKEEVRFAASLLGGKSFIAEEASEVNFKKYAANFRVLLLSMHSLVREDAPSFSKLLFSEYSSGGAEDDLLHALELSTVPLQADLAVLSACNTGFGKLYPGEGVMSMSGAFFSAGVPSMVMTLWKIPDATSPLIIKAFFRNLEAGMPKDVALQQAKIEFLENLPSIQEAHPYHWAGFIASGNMEPLLLNETGGGWAWVVTGLAVAGLVFFILKKIEKRPGFRFTLFLGQT